MATVSPGREVLEYAKLSSDLVYYGPASNRNKREIYIEREEDAESGNPFRRFESTRVVMNDYGVSLS